MRLPWGLSACLRLKFPTGSKASTNNRHIALFNHADNTAANRNISLQVPDLNARIHFLRAENTVPAICGALCLEQLATPTIKNHKFETNQGDA